VWRLPYHVNAPSANNQALPVEANGIIVANGETMGGLV
jgi:hypothetical protein